MLETTVVVLYLTDIIFLTTNILLLHIFLTPKRSLWVQAIAFIAAGFTVHWLRILLEPLAPNFLLRGFITGPLYLIPCTLLFKEKLNAIVFVFFLIYSLTQFNYLIFMHIDRFLSPTIPDTWVILGLLLEFALLPLIKKYAAPIIKNIIGIINQQNHSFVFFPILSFILLAFYGVQGTYVLSTFIPIVLSTIIIFFAYYLIALSIDRTRRQQQLEKQLAMQRNHYSNLTESITMAKTTRHDLRHHLVTMLELLAKKDVIATQKYLNHLCKFYDDSAIPSVCRNQSADALICHYLKLAKQQGISVVTNLNIPDDLGIDELELCVIIGNCLGNALEACSKMNTSEPRFIDIKTTITKGYLVIKIANSFRGLVQHQDNGSYFSEKGPEHGIGIPSVKSLTAKYQGHCFISFAEGIFRVSVSLRLPKIVTKTQ
ncbi:MAG: ATP-binding protein [Veillonellales bacterium]